MALSATAHGANSVRFNQDGTCVCVANSEGIRIYDIGTHQTCYKLSIGAIG